MLKRFHVIAFALIMAPALLADSGALYNLYESWQPMTGRISSFLRGQPVRFPSSVTLAPPQHLAR